MPKKYSLDDFDSEMEKIIEDFDKIPTTPIVRPSVNQTLNPLDVQTKVLAAARQRAAKLLNPESLI